MWGLCWCVELPRFSHHFLGIDFHARSIVSQSWLLFVGLTLANTCFTSYYKFSIGLKSGDCAGHSMTLALLSWNHWRANLLVCFRSLSCWKAQNSGVSSRIPFLQSNGIWYSEYLQCFTFSWRIHRRHLFNLNRWLVSIMLIRIYYRISEGPHFRFCTTFAIFIQLYRASQTYTELAIPNQ